MPSIENKSIFAGWLRNPNAFATTLLTIVVDVYGLEITTWLPDTIQMEIEDDFGIKLPNTSLDKIMAAIAILTGNDFYRSLPSFIELCNVLSDNYSTTGQFEPADAASVAWGITEAMLISPPDENDPDPFSKEIVSYVGEVVRSEGIMNPPDILKIGQFDSEIPKRVQADYADDPEMFATIYKYEAEKTNDINEMIKTGLKMLFEQLHQLRLENGNTGNAVKGLINSINRRQESESVLG